MSVAARVTIEQFLQLPEPKSGHYELHHGEVVLMAPPKLRHEQLQERIRALLKGALGKRGIVRVEMSFQAPENEFWRADVGVITPEREKQTPLDGYLRGAPDLVVEVLSPSNTVEEIIEKMHVCLENGCASFWVVNDKRKQVEVTGKDFVTQRLNVGDAIHADLLDVWVRVEEIFSEGE